MEHVELINRIIEAENKARQIADEALEKRSHLQEDLRDAKDSMHKTYMERAEHRIEMIRQREEKLAQDAIEELNVRFEKDMSDMERVFAADHAQWAEKLFVMTVRR